MSDDIDNCLGHIKRNCHLALTTVDNLLTRLILIFVFFFNLNIDDPLQ